MSETPGLAAALFNESPSSVAVNRFLVFEAGVCVREHAEWVDRLAATWLPQAVLDASRRRRRSLWLMI